MKGKTCPCPYENCRKEIVCGFDNCEHEEEVCASEMKCPYCQGKITHTITKKTKAKIAIEKYKKG